MLRSVAFLLTAFVFLAAPASAQTKWFKYKGNPVLSPTSGTWDAGNVWVDRVIFRDSTYLMWYSGASAGYGYPGGPMRLGHATSPNGVTWTKHPLNPVLNLGPTSWDRRISAFSHIIASDSGYKMWYTGGDSITTRIGYATSPDGVVWSKALSANPVLNIGESTSWDRWGVYFPTVLGPDSSGVLKMWYTGVTASLFGDQIGYATATNETTWTKHPTPVLGKGSPGSWEDHRVLYPKVLFNGTTYELWYIAGRDDFRSSRVGYATSLDGIAWTKSPENPVLLTGPMGSWDEVHFSGQDILFDGNVYHMWYNGLSGGFKLQVGYAISPKGTSISISKHGLYVAPGSDTVWVRAHVDSAAGLSFSAESESPDGTVNELLELFDDGLHGDSLAGDGLFGNGWLPIEEKTYFIDLKLTLSDTLQFEMNNAGIFTTIGPLRYESHAFTTSAQVKDTIPNPGDTVLIKVVIRNDGSTATAPAITATLSTEDTSVTEILSYRPNYGNLAPGAMSTTEGYYWIVIKPNSPANRDIKLDLSISSSGVAFWKDTLNLRVGDLIDNVTLPGKSISPSSYSLSDNFPNPFNPSTKIQFTIHHSRFTSLKVFDLLGREVATLVNEELKQGSYQVTWDAAGFPSGVYFYRLEAGQFAETRKLVLVR